MGRQEKVDRLQAGREGKGAGRSQSRVKEAGAEDEDRPKNRKEGERCSLLPSMKNAGSKEGEEVEGMKTMEE